MMRARSKRWRLSLGVPACCGLLSAAAQTTNLPPLAVWETDLQVTAAIGHRDNVLFSSVSPENSAYARSSVDATVMRLSETDALFMIFMLGEDTRYLDSTAVDYEQFVSANTLFSIPAGQRNELGLEAGYTYQHQIFDASANELNLRRILVEGHSLSAAPYWERRLGDRWSAVLKGLAVRQLYEGQLDDYWDAGGEWTLVYQYGHTSQAALAYEKLYRRYDTREQVDQTGFAEPGTDLIHHQDQLTAQLKHYWDAARRRRTTTRLDVMANRDNGSGYFDYDRIRLKQQLRWEHDPWSIRANARFGWYRYQQQSVDGHARERSYAVLGLRAERSFGPHWTVFAEGEREWNNSNDPLDEYRAWTAGCGAGYTF